MRLLLRLCARACVRVCVYRLECSESGSQTLPQQGIRHQQLPGLPCPPPLSRSLGPWALLCALFCSHGIGGARHQQHQLTTNSDDADDAHCWPRRDWYPERRRWSDGRATHCNYPARQQQARRPCQNTRGGGDVGKGISGFRKPRNFRRTPSDSSSARC